MYLKGKSKDTDISHLHPAKVDRFWFRALYYPEYPLDLRRSLKTCI